MCQLNRHCSQIHLIFWKQLPLNDSICSQYQISEVIFTNIGAQACFLSAFQDSGILFCNSHFHYWREQRMASLFSCKLSAIVVWDPCRGCQISLPYICTLLCDNALGVGTSQTKGQGAISDFICGQKYVWIGSKVKGLLFGIFRIKLQIVLRAPFFFPWAIPISH